MNLHRLVAAHGPELFAVGVEYEGEDCEIVAWGLAFPGRTDVVSLDGCHHIRTTSPERVLRHFRDSGGKLHLVWLSHGSSDVARHDHDRL
ncbi:hypothetical protein ACQPW3_35865 [Actinosynnema sp. CA-248983]